MAASVELTQETLSNCEFDTKLNSLFQQVKEMKLKYCVTIDKKNGSRDIANVVKVNKAKRQAVTNEIVFKMDDYCNWSIGDHNMDEIIVNENSIVLFETDSMKVVFVQSIEDISEENDTSSLSLEYIHENWRHDEEADKYWIEMAEHGYVVYLPDEDIFIVNEGTAKEYTAGRKEITSLLGLSDNTVNKEVSKVSRINVLKARETFNKENKGYFVLDKKYSYTDGLYSERDKVEMLVNMDSKIVFEGNRYWIDTNENMIAVSKMGMKYYEYLKTV